MIIKGLQKLTLLDFPEKIACIIFTEGCNFKCPFCHNASLVVGGDDSFIPEDEFFDYLNKRKGMIEGVVVSGGEPTFQYGLEVFLKKIKNMGFVTKLDTNGYRPDILKRLVNANLLDYVAMDIKNSKEKYPLTCGKEALDISLVNESVNFLLTDIVDYEFRTTVVKQLHEQQDFEKIGKWIKGAKRYYLQSFKDSGDVICEGFGNYDEKEMENLLNLIKPYVPTAKTR